MSKRQEMLLFRYSSALERGDFETVAVVLREAERDPALEAMIVEMNEAYAAEQTERFNHTNHKEIPMLAPLYQNRTRTNNRLQSLLMIAAITLVAVIGVLLTTQMRENSIFNTSQPNTTGMIAQREALCEAVTYMGVSVLSLPSSTNGVVVGTIPAGVTVNVLDQNYFLDEEGNVQLLWYFIAANAVQGWAPPAMLERRDCPQNQLNQPVNRFTATPAPFNGTPWRLGPSELTATERALESELSTQTPEPFLFQPTIVPPDVRGLATSTPFPFNVLDITTLPTEVPSLSEPTGLPPTVVPPEVWLPTFVPVEASVEISTFPVYVVEQGDTLLSILQKFGFDASVMQDMTIVNRLPEDAALMPGQVILLPYNMPDLVTTCMVVPEQTLQVLAEPASGETTIVTTLPGGTIFKITGESQQPDGVWVSISAQVGSVTISGGWVRVDTLDFRTGCQTDFAPTVQAGAMEATPTTVPLMTATLLPSFTPTPAR